MEFDPEDEEAAAMAAAMGFSSFGSHKPPAKKRKFNPSTDAFVEGDELEKLDRGGKKGSGSGGNTMPLGKMRVFGKPKAVERSNEDEIDLGVDEEDASDGEPQYEDTSRTPPAESTSDGPRYMVTSQAPPIDEADGDEQGPMYIDTSEEAPAIASVSHAERAEMQARIDAILSSIESAPPPPGSETLPLHSAPGGLPRPPGLPNRPAYDASFQNRARGGGRGAFSDTASMASSGAARGGGSQRGGRGQYNEKWYEGYYDPSFNENPWAKLEQAKGLQPVGSWIKRPERE